MSLNMIEWVGFYFLEMTSGIIARLLRDEFDIDIFFERI